VLNGKKDGREMSFVHDKSGYLFINLHAKKSLKVRINAHFYGDDSQHKQR
jgi:hypothetical protein